MEASSLFVEEKCVGTMTEDDAFASRESSVHPLPDLILHSSPSATRRNRSVSVSLPLDRVMCQQIGRSLRRLSDRFDRERELANLNQVPQRRGTMDGTYSRPS